MLIVLAIIIGLMAFALLMFALLARQLAPTVFMLMRVQASNAETMSDLLTTVENLELLPDIEVREFEDLKARIARLERAMSKPATRTRKKVTA